MRLIDADAFWKAMTTRFDSCADLGEIMDVLDSMPTLSPDDLRGVVHCRDCRYAERRTPIGIKTEILCRLFSAGMKAHDYCSYGAKMEVTDDA